MRKLLFKEYMKKRRYNYGSMAEALNVSRLTIANWDKGVTSPNLKQANNICNLLGIEFVDLLKNAKEKREDYER